MAHKGSQKAGHVNILGVSHNLPSMMGLDSVSVKGHPCSVTGSVSVGLRTLSTPACGCYNELDA